MRIELSNWTHHLNHLLYSYFYFCKKEKLKVTIEFNIRIPHNGAVLIIGEQKAFFDYIDDSKFISNFYDYDYYFKRSLRPEDHNGNIHPLNFNVPLSYKPLNFLLHQNLKFLSFKSNKNEVLRALDNFALFTNSSHRILDIRNYPQHIEDRGGRVVFYTRLWNPENHPDSDEKDRRRLQNDFRINACRIIRDNFRDAAVGLFPDPYSTIMAPDLLLKASDHKKKKYLSNLNHFNIGVADDGLKDNPGWKIGEYALQGKAIITTPLNIALDNFNSGENYVSLTTRNSYEELPDAIRELRSNTAYMEMCKKNLDWSAKYIHPSNYIDRILDIMKATIS